MSHLARLGLALLLSTLAACGGKANGSPDDDGRGGTSAGGSGTGATGTGATGTGGKGQAGSTGAGGANACSRLDDDSPGSVNVAISNRTSATIYLGQQMVTCEVPPLFEVADAAGATLPSLSFCRQSCRTLRTDGGGGCVSICPVPSVVALQPNETLYTTWDGLFQVQGQLPASCVPNPSGVAQVSCNQAKRIEPDTYTFSARAGSSLDCLQTTGTAACPPCTPADNGGCTTPVGLITGAMHTAQATVLLDERYGVYPKPSASPGPNAGDAELPAPGDAIAVLAVELVFTE